MILGLWTRLGLVRANFRGTPLPTGLGFFIGVAALIAAYWQHDVWHSLAALVSQPTSVALERAAIASATRPVGLIALAAACIGLVDDMTAQAGPKGFRGHFGQLAGGRLTTGAIKALFGGGVGLAASLTLFVLGRGTLYPLPDRTWWMVIPDALVIALAMNAFNLLDLRPGRALKVWLPLAAGLWAAAYLGAPQALRLAYVQPQLMGAIAVALLLLPLDLREKCMLGDSGTMTLGALVGWSIIATMGMWARLSALVVLAALHIATERISLSSLIDSVAPLRFMDRLGRPAEDPTS